MEDSFDDEFEFVAEDIDGSGEEDLDPAAGDQVDGELEVDGKKVVPLDVVKKIRSELKAEKDAHAATRTAVNIIAQQQKPGQQADQVKDPVFGDLEDDDVLTVAQMRQILGTVQAQTTQAVSEATVASQHKDYHQVIQKYLPQLLKEKPHMAAAIRGAQNQFMVAYDLAKTTPAYLRDRAKARALREQGGEGGTAKERQIRTNLRKPGSGLSAGSNVGGSSRLDAVLAESDTDFESHVQRVLKGSN